MSEREEKEGGRERRINIYLIKRRETVVILESSGGSSQFGRRNLLSVSRLVR